MYKGMNTNRNTKPSRRFNPLNDFLFYKTMGERGDEPQLIGFLNAVLMPSGRKPIETLEIIEKWSLPDYVNIVKRPYPD